jgi:hypothetical protein
MVIETNGGRTGKFGVIFLIFIDEAQYLSMKLRPLETVKSIILSSRAFR